VTIRDLTTNEPNLEDIFLHLTGAGGAPARETTSQQSPPRKIAQSQGIPGRRGPPGEDPSRPGGL
jgi:hypothetical protein